MHDFHVATIQFLNPLLKSKQLQMAKAVNTPRFSALEQEFENLRNRLCLEIVYAIEAESGGCAE